MKVFGVASRRVEPHVNKENEWSNVETRGAVTKVVETRREIGREKTSEHLRIRQGKTESVSKRKEARG